MGVPAEATLVEGDCPGAVEAGRDLRIESSRCDYIRQPSSARLCQEVVRLEAAVARVQWHRQDAIQSDKQPCASIRDRRCFADNLCRKCWDRAEPYDAGAGRRAARPVASKYHWWGQRFRSPPYDRERVRRE